MPLGTLDASPPPFFRQGPSALSKLVFFGLLAVLLMVADARFGVVQPARAAVATALYPLQWLMLRPVDWLKGGSEYLTGLNQSQATAAAAQYRLGLQSQRAQQVEQLAQENARLRQLLGLQERLNARALAAQVLYEAADPFTRKLVVDKGALAAVELGSPVLDDQGVLGQVTRVYPLVSEVTLLTDRDLIIPVLNARSGVRALAFGGASLPGQAASALELRYLDANVDMQEGDLLTTSGMDGVYPPGLQVAYVRQIERGVASAFARIVCEPVARIDSGLHVLLLQPLQNQVPARPDAASLPGNHRPVEPKP